MRLRSCCFIEFNQLFRQFQLDLGDQQDDLSMFSVEEGDAKDVYPDVENALDCFNTGDALQQRNRGENNCNYDWADDIDVLNVLHSVNDWPVTLQVILCE